MKHTVKITTILIVMFFISHLIGLYVVNSYLGVGLPFNIEKPKLEKETAYFPIMITLFIATLLALLLIRLKAFSLWKVWFFLAIVFCLTVSFGAFIGNYGIILAFIFAYFKVFRQNFYLHNIGELFLYGGLVAFFAESFSLISAYILLVAISIYDWYAVNKSKHMVKMAEFQAKAKVFAGLFVPYQIKKGESKIITGFESTEKKGTKIPSTNAILGGGDIGFTLLFSAAVLQEFGMKDAIIVSIFTTIALAYLFMYAEKNKYYPAMPFLTAGATIGMIVMRFI